MLIIQKSVSRVLMVAGLALAVSACTGTGYKRQNDYSPAQCKNMFGRGMINLEQKRDCVNGRAFEMGSVGVKR